jgi:hypothetical protein
MTHGVIGNTSDFGSAESWFEPRWVNKKRRKMRCFLFNEVPQGIIFPKKFSSLFKPGSYNYCLWTFLHFYKT